MAEKTMVKKIAVSTVDPISVEPAAPPPLPPRRRSKICTSISCAVRKAGPSPVPRGTSPAGRTRDLGAEGEDADDKANHHDLARSPDVEAVHQVGDEETSGCVNAPHVSQFPKRN